MNGKINAEGSGDMLSTQNNRIFGQCSEKHANPCLFLKKVFAELQI